MTPRKPLCCVACDEPCYEVKSTERDGRIRKSARCIVGSRQVTLVMHSGSRATLTICACCEVTPENMLTLWRRCSVGPMQEHRRDEKRTEMLLQQHRDVPIGVLTVRPHEHVGRDVQEGLA